MQSHADEFVPLKAPTFPNASQVSSGPEGPVHVSLDEEAISARTARRRRGRGFQRIMAGLGGGATIRLVTLTSSDDAPPDIQRSWRILTARLRRRWPDMQYVRVKETVEDGREHLHVVVRCRYVEYAYIRAAWDQIHLSSVTDIRKLKKKAIDSVKVASYLCKYLVKDLSSRLSPSRWWLYPGACKDWQTIKSAWFGWRRYHGQPCRFSTLCVVFENTVRQLCRASDLFLLLGLGDFGAYVGSRMPFPPPQQGAGGGGR